MKQKALIQEALTTLCSDINSSSQERGIGIFFFQLTPRVLRSEKIVLSNVHIIRHHNRWESSTSEMNFSAWPDSLQRIPHWRIFLWFLSASRKKEFVSLCCKLQSLHYHLINGLRFYYVFFFFCSYYLCHL